MSSVLLCLVVWCVIFGATAISNTDITFSTATRLELEQNTSRTTRHTSPTSTVRPPRRPRPDNFTPAATSATVAPTTTTLDLGLSDLRVPAGAFRMLSFPALRERAHVLQLLLADGSSLSPAAPVQPYGFGSWFVSPAPDAEAGLGLVLLDPGRLEQPFFIDFPPPTERLSHVFWLRTALKYEALVTRSRRRVHLTSAVAAVFGDLDPRHVQVTALREEIDGSVLLEWSNSSLQSATCPSAAVRTLSAQLLQGDELKPRAWALLEQQLTMLPCQLEPVVLAAGLRAAGPCSPHDLGLSSAPGVTPTHRGATYLLSVVLPCLIIALLIFTAVVVACCLYRSRRRKHGKPRVNGAVHRGGAPLVLLDELRPNASSRPLLLEEPRFDEAAANNNVLQTPPVRKPPPYSPVSTLRRV